MSIALRLSIQFDRNLNYAAYEEPEELGAFTVETTGGTCRFDFAEQSAAIDDDRPSGCTTCPNRMNPTEGSLSACYGAPRTSNRSCASAWNDTFWGVCRGNGQNRLGRILMEVRDGLRDESL